MVTIGRPPERADRAGITRWAEARVHSGHWKPTEACTMQLGQMGRPQRWQVTPARRSVCR
jgi:hypothetical protein